MKGKISVEISPSKTDFAEPEIAPGKSTKAKTSDQDSEEVVQRRSRVKAASEPEKLRTDKALRPKSQK
jgi:hypothetical protein